jgi:hypothetical protein
MCVRGVRRCRRADRTEARSFFQSSTSPEYFRPSKTHTSSHSAALTSDEHLLEFSLDQELTGQNTRSGDHQHSLRTYHARNDHSSNPDHFPPCFEQRRVRLRHDRSPGWQRRTQRFLGTGRRESRHRWDGTRRHAPSHQGRAQKGPCGGADQRRIRGESVESRKPPFLVGSGKCDSRGIGRNSG